MANSLSTAQWALIIGCLCESMSIRATARVTGGKHTATKLLVDFG